MKFNVHHKYDGFDRRISKTTNGVVTKFFYHGEDIVAEFTEDNKLLALYLHGPGIDDPIAMVRDVNGDESFSNSEIFFYAKDHLGSVHALVDINGKVVQRYSYSAYGRTRIEKIHENDKLIKNPYAYTSREWEQETGDYFNRMRFYNPNTGRFLSLDPIKFRGGEYNLYAYARQNPIRYFDVTGLAPGDKFGSEADAGYDALNYINVKSILEGREYAGNIYKNSDGSYSYTNPRPGTQATSNPGPFTSNTTAFYHTHGSEDPNYFNNDFSPADETISRITGLNSYLGTPSQGFKLQDGLNGDYGPLNSPNSCGGR